MGSGREQVSSLSVIVPVLVSTCIAIAIATVIVIRHRVDASAVYYAATPSHLHGIYTVHDKCTNNPCVQ
jgi:hypothetical protein